MDRKMISVNLKQEPASPSELPQVMLVFVHIKCIIKKKEKVKFLFVLYKEIETMFTTGKIKININSMLFKKIIIITIILEISKSVWIMWTKKRWIFASILWCYVWTKKTHSLCGCFALHSYGRGLQYHSFLSFFKRKILPNNYCLIKTETQFVNFYPA